MEIHGEDTGGFMEGKMVIRTPRTEQRRRNEDDGRKMTERSNDDDHDLVDDGDDVLLLVDDDDVDDDEEEEQDKGLPSTLFGFLYTLTNKRSHKYPASRWQMA
jgi:hypothetical protein